MILGAPRFGPSFANKAYIYFERWLPRPAEAGEGPEGVQRIRRLGVSMGENAPSGREKLGGRMRNWFLSCWISFLGVQLLGVLSLKLLSLKFLRFKDFDYVFGFVDFMFLSL